jgi:hypothetical protein
MSVTERRRFRWLAPVALLAFFASASHGGIIYVDVANESGTEDGTLAFPYNTIQEGIDNAATGDKVSVAAGIYKETILMKDGVSVLGAGPAVTTIDGEGLSNSVVNFNGTRLSPLLTGFTITGGTGDTSGDIGGVPVNIGGGILLLNSSAVITRNVITQNIVDEGYCLGGGIYVYVALETPIISDNVISQNVARSTTQADSGEGGGIYVVAKNGGVVITNNLIEANDGLKGGGIYIQNVVGSMAEITRNTIRNNDAPMGAGVYSTDSDDSTTSVENNLFEGNGSTEAAARGGGVLAKSDGTGAFTIANNTFVQNTLSTGEGAGLWLDDSASTILNVAANNIFAGNSATQGGAIAHTDFFGEIRNNDFHANVGGDLYDAGGSGALLVGNLFVDPQFVSSATANYRLQSTSPCLDQADEPFAPVDDRDGFYRPFDGDGDLSATSDIGAFEYPGGEVSGLVFLGDGSMDWQPQPLQDGFNLYRGSLQRLRDTGEYTQDPVLEPLAAATCNLLLANLPYDDGFSPPADTTVFYLVTLFISDWEASLGTDSVGLLRPHHNPCP